MKEQNKCPHCGRLMVMQKHNFSRVLSRMLLKTASRFFLDQPFHLQRDLELTKNEYNNFQKLKYWGLIQKYFDKGLRKSGYWVLTLGVRGVLHGYKIPRWVKTFNNRVIERAEERIYLSQAIGEYNIPKEWSGRAELVDSNKWKQQILLEAELSTGLSPKSEKTVFEKST